MATEALEQMDLQTPRQSWKARDPVNHMAAFGPVQEAPEGASAADQLAAFLGRTP